MSRRPINPSRRISESGTTPFSSSVYSRSRSPPYLSLGLIILGAFLLLVYLYGGQGSYALNKRAVSRVEEVLSQPIANRCDYERADFYGDFSCTLEVQRAIPILRKAYGDSMHKVLHVGPDTCSVVSQLLKEEDTEAWGVEPYDIEDADGTCKSLVHKGIVRVVDIKFPLPYWPKSFSLVIASDALDYLSPKYLNKTLPELARVSADGVVIFTGILRHRRSKVLDKSKFRQLAKLRSSTWWIRFFLRMSLEENEDAVKKFEQAAEKRSYSPSCQIFHLKPYN